MATALAASLALLAAPASAQGAPGIPADYAKPVRLDDGAFWRVHRLDLERCVDDRNAFKACVETRDGCQAERLEDVTNPPVGLNMTWWQATIAGAVTIVVTLLARKGVGEAF